MSEPICTRCKDTGLYDAACRPHLCDCPAGQKYEEDRKEREMERDLARYASPDKILERATKAEQTIIELRRKLAEAGVEGSPPPGRETTIGALLRRATTAEEECRNLKKVVNAAFVAGMRRAAEICENREKSHALPFAMLEAGKCARVIHSRADEEVASWSAAGWSAAAKKTEECICSGHRHVSFDGRCGWVGDGSIDRCACRVEPA